MSPERPDDSPQEHESERRTLRDLDRRLRAAAAARRAGRPKCPGAGRDECPLGEAVLRALEGRPAPAILRHLSECATCRETATVHRLALDADRRVDRVPDAVRRRVETALARRPRRRLPLPAAAAAAALAALVVLLALPEESPLRADVSVDAFAGTGERADLVRLRARLDRPGFVYGVVSYTLGAAWRALPLSPTVGGDVASERHEVLGDLPEGAVLATCALISTPRPLAPGDRGALEAAAVSSGDPERSLAALEGLARRFRGVVSVKRVPRPGDPLGKLTAADDIETAARAGDARLLDRLVREFPLAAAEAAARSIEAALAPGAAREASFRAAEAIARALGAERGGVAIGRRIRAARAWSGDPALLAERRRLDDSILRPVEFHDENAGRLEESLGGSRDAALAALAAAAEAYGRMGDEAGAIECGLRSALLRPARPAESGAVFEDLLVRSRAAAHARGEAFALAGIAMARWREIGEHPFEEIRGRTAAATSALLEIGAFESAGVSESNLAFFLLQRGALGEAFERLRQAYLLHEVAGAEFVQAVDVAKLAWAHELVNRPRESFELATEAAARFARLAEEGAWGRRAARVAEAKSLWRASLAESRLSRFESALETAGRAERAALEALDRDSAGRARDAAARALLGQGRIDEAIRRAEEAIAAAPAEENPWHRAFGCLTLGLALEAAGRSAEAEAAEREALGLFRRPNVLDRIGAAEALDRIARHEEARGDLDAARATRLSHLDIAESVADERGLLAIDRASLRERFRDALSAGVELAARLARERGEDPTPLALRFMEAARPASLDQLGDRRERAFERDEVSLEALRGSLDEGDAWVEVLLGPRTSFALVVEREGAVLRDLSTTTRDEAARRCAALRARLLKGEAPEAVDEAARAVHAALVEPIAADLEGRRTIRFSFDGGTMPVPPAALLDSAGRRLARSHAVTIEPSARIALASRSLSREGEAEIAPQFGRSSAPAAPGERSAQRATHAPTEGAGSSPGATRARRRSWEARSRPFPGSTSSPAEAATRSSTSGGAGTAQRTAAT